MPLTRRDFLQASAVGVLATIRPQPARGLQDRDWTQLRVSGERVNQHLADLSRFGRNPQGGVSRLAFSPEDIAGREFTMGLMRQAGLEVRIDAAGNILGRRAGSDDALPPILFGSHIDSVPEGGDYDGDLGSMAAIEAAQTLAEAGYRNRHPLEVVVWCDEEGGLTGSRAVVGLVSDEELAEPGRDGVPLAEKIRRIGAPPSGSGKHGEGGATSRPIWSCTWSRGASSTTTGSRSVSWRGSSASSSAT